MRICPHLLLALLLAPYSAGESRHPFTFEEMMALKRVEEPVVSPDGKWVLFAAVDVDLKSNTKTPHVWVVPLPLNPPVAVPSPSSPVSDNRAEREIISDQDADRPRWAPDGKRFAFVSTKEQGSQIWIADFDEASGTVTAKRRLTNIATEADGELWSPDGRNLLFVSRIYPECATESCNAQKLEESKDGKVKALIFEHLLYRHWNGYRESKRSHLFVLPFSAETGKSPGAEPGPSPRDLTPGDHDVPPFHLGGQDMYAFSPDGQELCFTSNHEEEEAISTNNDLFTVPVNIPADASPDQVLQKTRNITAGNKAADETPLYSPDGRYIAYRAQQRPGYESDRWRLRLYDRKTGQSKELTEGFDDWVESFAWAPDSKTIYFSADHERHALIYAVPSVPASARDQTKRNFPRRALVGGYNDDLSVMPGGKTLVFTRMSMVAPNEIYLSNAGGPGCAARSADVDTGKDSCSLGVALTRVNEQVLSAISMSKAESFWFKGAKGDNVEGILVYPPNFDRGRKYPLKFLIHGGPEGAWGDDWSYRWNPQLFAANGYVAVMINFHGSTGYGQKFTDAINGDWGGAPFEDLMKGLDYAEQHYTFIDKDRECALGASYGGYMSNWILGHSNRFKCIVSHDGMFNSESAWGTTEELWFNEWECRGTPYNNRELYRKWSPHLAASDFKTPTLVIHGQLDYRLDVSEGFQLFTTLQRQGVPSKMLYFPDEGHWVLKPQNSQLWYKTVNDWVDQWVGRR
ncbi:MAG: S9 family peptidase [Acidobacteria bacterium]|nr:S9 family peptidase [Acidobacteriota bacterium]